MTRQHRRLFLLGLLCVCSTVVLHATPPATLIDEAWHAWEQGDQALVERKFLDAVAQDPADSRAHLGLSFLYSLQRKYEAAWREYAAAIAAVPDRAPYLYAAWVTPKFSRNIYNDKSGVFELVHELAEKGDRTGTLRAMANETLLDYSRYRDRSAEAAEYSRAMNCITTWKVIGPFDNVSGSGFAKAYPPEGKFDSAATYPGKIGIPTWWFEPAGMRQDNWVDFTRYFARDDAVFYANTFVYSPTTQPVSFRIGTSGSFKVFLNDELVNETDEEQNNDLDTYVAQTTLQQGWNRVLVKCGYSEIGSCNFMVRLTDSAGLPLAGLRTSTAAQDYRSMPGAHVERFENFAEAHFRKLIAAHPDHLENYLLLADCFLRNDKGIDAELTLRQALALAPGSPLLYDRLLEAYQRGDKQDEIERTLEKIYSIDKAVPAALEYKFGQYIKTEEYERAESVMEQFETLLPRTPEAYQMRLQLYARKQLAERVIETAQEAYQHYPGDPDFVKAKAALVEQTTNNPMAAIRVYDDFLEGGVDESVMRAQARLYLGMSNLDQWRAIYDKLIALNPASPGYHQYLAGVYFDMRKYEEASAEVLNAIRICPSSSALWSKLGEINRIQGNTTEAVRCYRKALAYDRTDYEARAIIRDLEGSRPAYEQFAKVDIDSVIAYARDMENDPDDGAVVVFDRAQHVIYEPGAWEATQEIVVKVLNGRGIDDWKEYVIPANRYNEELIVDKAVVVKPDGSETKADANDNYIVFKALEENDIIHLKWHTKSHYSGKLSSQFFDTYSFNGYYPVKHVSYELVAPSDFKFNYRTQGMTTEPTKHQVTDGTLYVWTRDTIPAISYEYGMPTLDDVGAMLFVSSIDSWGYLVDWYTDVATSRSKTTFEVAEQVHELLEGKESASDEEKMRAVYDFITENIRYSSVAFRQGAYIPQKARDVLVNRIGDCKDVATLCIAMLREAGLKAHYVLVNTHDEGTNRNALPSIVFNHCIVAVETGGQDRYLDLTANNYPIGSIPEGDAEAFALVIKPGVTAPTFLPPGPIARTVHTRSTLTLAADNSMSGHTSTVASGSPAAVIRDYFRDQPRKEQEKKLLAGLGSTYPNVKLSGLTFEHLVDLSPTSSYAYDFEVPNYLSEAGSFRILKMPWSHREESDRALSYETRDYPYDYSPGNDTLIEEIELTIPPGYVPIELPGTAIYHSPIADYALSYSYSNSRLTARRQFVNKKRTVEVNDYAAFKAFHSNVVKEDGRLILLQRKGR